MLSSSALRNAGPLSLFSPNGAACSANQPLSTPPVSAADSPLTGRQANGLPLASSRTDSSRG